ncbi:MAG: N-acetylneuraminate synthase family protein [Sandaracinaceae bacterium]|nr:N-acetylneuraminate synthase family protein [Sandaracinaceae bacterium]
MIRQAALSGADVAKFQLYDAVALLGSDRWSYLQLDRPTVERVKRWCEQDGIEFMASVFDEERLGWCEDLAVSRYKVASRTVGRDPALCQRVLETGKPVIMSLGEWSARDLPFGRSPQISYLFCKSAYPAFLEDFRTLSPGFRGRGSGRIQ